MAHRDRALTFRAGDAALVGIVSSPVGAASDLGVLIVVGGPQYRVGSHRQFVLLARDLAGAGFSTMRFDCTGMGDSDGPPRAFTDRSDDLRAAVDAFLAAEPAVRRVAIWGLCDAVSAALLYACDDPRVTNLVLLNPWVRSDVGLAKTHLKHHYTAKLVDRDFWLRLLRGQVGVFRALREFVGTVASARGKGGGDPAASYQQRMAEGWKRFPGDILLIASGDDLTAREFLDHAAADRHWAGLLDEPRVMCRPFPEADHTFSRAGWRAQVAQWTIAWLRERAGASSGEGRRARIGEMV